MINKKIAFLIINVFSGVFLLFGCTKQLAVAPQQVNSPPIAAKAAIAPVQIISANIDLPYSGRKNIPLKFSGPIKKKLETHINSKNIFSQVVPVKEEALPSSPGIAEIAQAGREAGADLVLLGKIIEFDNRIEYGLRPALLEHMVLELTLYEAGTGLRVWHSQEGVDLEKPVPIASWSEKMIESEYISLAEQETLTLALDNLIPRLYKDMSDYKPPVAENVPTGSAEFVVDVDRVPSVPVKEKENAFAVVVGIEAYRDLPPAEFAVRDARIMKEYLIRVMGFPEENIVTLLNERATKNDIEGYLSMWLKNNVEKDSVVFVYYAGHGAPNPVTGEAYIIPFDGNPAFPEATAFPLKKMYRLLDEFQVKETIVVMDSCFSGGGGRSLMAQGGRPIAVSVENSILGNSNLMVMTAATGTEISSSYPEKRHGLFTYFFLKGLQGDADFNGDKIVSIGELYNYLTPKVKKVARTRNLEQTPMLLPGIELLGDRAIFPLGVVIK